MLVVISIVAIVSGIILTSIEPSWHDQLQGAARIVAADLTGARELAVTNNSSYAITFDRANNLYYLEHSGTNTALDTLPKTGFGLQTDPATRRTTDFSRLPLGTAQVRLYIVQEDSQTTIRPEVSQLEFGPLGETTQTKDTMIWLAVGQESSARYLSLRVHRITGLASIGDYETTPPDIAMAPIDTDAWTTGTSTRTDTDTGGIDMGGYTY